MKFYVTDRDDSINISLSPETNYEKRMIGNLIEDNHFIKIFPETHIGLILFKKKVEPITNA